MPMGLRRFVLSAVAVAAVATGSHAVLAAPATEPMAASPQSVTPSAIVTSGSKAVFVPVTQKRVLATTTVSPTSPRKVTVAGVAGVPTDALAVVVNVAAVKPAKAGFLVAYPAGTTRPSTVYTLTYAAGQVDESIATVKVGSLRQITVYVSTTTPVVVDVAGYYVDHNHDDAYLPKAQAQGRSALNALTCPTGSLIRSVAADGATTCVQDATGPVTGVGTGLLLDNGVLSAQQGRSAANAFTCAAGQFLQKVAADGTPTCVADTSGSSFTVGEGLLLDGAVLSAEQGRSATNAFTCQTGQVLRAVAKDGAPSCVVDKDTDTTYGAGFGLMLLNGTFSAEQGRSAANAFTCPAGQYLQAVAANGAPTCAADRDTDTNTTYSAGFGLMLLNGTFSAEQGRSAANAFSCPAGQYLQAASATGAPTCVADKDTDTNTTYSAGFGLMLLNGTFSAEQGRSAANAFSCPAGQYLQAASATGAPTCVADKDTDTNTTYSAGFGLMLLNGTFSAEQGRSAANAFSCPAGQYLQAASATGAPTCVADKDTTYAAGAGLSLANGTFTAEQRRSVVNAFTCPPGQYLRVVAADGTPSCAVDTDTNTTYTAGTGLLLNNGVFSAEQGRSAANAFTCAVGQYLQVVAANGAPTCAADRDTDTDTNTTYEAGLGLLLEGNVFSAEQSRATKFPFFCEPGHFMREVANDGFTTCDVDQTGPTYAPGFGIGIDGSTISAQQGRSAANAFTCPVGQYLRHIAADGAPTCAADANTTYTAGAGLALSGTTFSLAEGANVVRVRGDSIAAADNGARLRSTLASLPFVPTAARPIAVVLSPGQYDIGTGTNMAVPAYLTLVGSGRDATTITGSFGAGSSGLLELGTGSTLASIAVKNSAGTNAAVAPIVVNGGTARLFDVAGTATGTAAGPTAFGLVVFSGANVVVEQSTFTASGPSSAYALYAVSATLRGSNITGTATSGTGAAYGVAGGSSSTVDLQGGSLTATSTAGGTPYVAGELGGLDVVRIAHAKLTGGLYGTPTCFGAYDASYAARSC